MSLNLRVCSTFIRKFSKRIIANEPDLISINYIIYKYCPLANFDNDFPEYSLEIEVFKDDFINMINQIKENDISVELKFLKDFELILKESDPNNEFIYLYWF